MMASCRCRDMISCKNENKQETAMPRGIVARRRICMYKSVEVGGFNNGMACGMRSLYLLVHPQSYAQSYAV